MSKITPLMTSLHEGHKAEERFKCIDDTLKHCEDTKYTVLQAFWWYRKYTKAKLQKLEQIEQILKARSFTDDIGNACYLDDSERIGRIKEVLEQE